MKLRVKYKLSDTCLYIFWFLIQVGKGLGYTSKNTELIIFLLCGIPFGIAKMALTKWSKKEFWVVITLNLLGVVIALCSGTTTYLLTIFFITAIKGMDVSKLLKVSLFVRGSLFVVRSSLAILGIIDMQISYRYVNGIATARYALGYGHPNTTQFEIFMIFLLVVLLYRERLKWYHYATFLHIVILSIPIRIAGHP